MNRTLDERFESLKWMLKSNNFLDNRGLGNEVGYYIFDYNPRDELLIRENIKLLEKDNRPVHDGYTIQVFNLYHIMIELLESKKYLEIVEKWEKEHGIEFIATRLNRLLKMDDFDDAEMYFTKYILGHAHDNAVIILTGIGEIYPLVRAHAVLNKMHLVYTHRPVIMMYPGEYV